jgi:hypothetical protein
MKKLVLTLPAVNGGQDAAVLTEKSDLFVYVDGNKTSDVPIGTKFVIALQGNKLSPLTVKIKGNDPLPNGNRRFHRQPHVKLD